MALLTLIEGGADRLALDTEGTPWVKQGGWRWMAIFSLRSYPPRVANLVLAAQREFFQKEAA